jgi:hypothetical protein
MWALRSPRTDYYAPAENMLGEMQRKAGPLVTPAGAGALLQDIASIATRQKRRPSAYRSPSPGVLCGPAFRRCSSSPSSRVLLAAASTRIAVNSLRMSRRSLRMSLRNQPTHTSSVPSNPVTTHLNVSMGTASAIIAFPPTEVRRAERPPDAASLTGPSVSSASASPRCAAPPPNRA